MQKTRGEDAPVLENNVDIGVGANLIGDIHIASNIKIGANALVNKSFEDENTILVGVPAKSKKLGEKK